MMYVAFNVYSYGHDDYGMFVQSGFLVQGNSCLNYCTLKRLLDRERNIDAKLPSFVERAMHNFCSLNMCSSQPCEQLKSD